ncbi:MAG: FAD-dependent oxidoreductase [Nitratireductor sp.]|nr:FAD-dependent oxidoreductase [Nitratireductor sp.]
MKIAVIGSGISGNSAAWALSRQHEVTIFEEQDRAGGHSATVDVDYDGVTIPVDTGFIVYNEGNYPLLTRLFDQLGVKTELTEMSFSVSLNAGRFEWCGRTLKTVFAQKRNMFSPGFLMMLGDILRFNAKAKRDLEAGVLCGLTFGDYMDRRGFSRRLRDDYIVPLTAAIWSTPAAKMLEFPAESLIRFLDNHRLIHMQRPWWRTVSGGSREYVSRLLADFSGEILLSTPVSKVTRRNGKVQITDQGGKEREFDAVVIATHSDQALSLLGDASAAERSLLSAVQYRPNKVYLHRDPALMPKRQDAWASWNYIGTRDTEGHRDINVTYWMNQLQNIDRRYPLFITLNPPVAPREELTFAQFEYSHPQFDGPALAAQIRLGEIQGAQNTWFAGAWTRYGFHEDGLASGLEAASLIGCDAPWTVAERKGHQKLSTLLLEAAE